jgi:hypothetical protein
MRPYQRLATEGITDTRVADALRRIDIFLQEVHAQLSTQASAGGTSSSGVVTSISANSGVDLQGDVNFNGGTGVSLSQAGQDITVAVNTGALIGGTPTTIAPDDAAAAGGATTASASDHRHAIVAAATPAAGIAHTTAEGVATSFARSDHDHLLGRALGRGGENVADANIGMAGFSFANLGGCTSSNAATLVLVANPADSGSVVGVKYVWASGVATPTAGARAHSFYFRDNVAADNEMFNMSTRNHGALSATSAIFRAGSWVTGDMYITHSNGPLNAEAASIELHQAATSTISFRLNAANILSLTSAGGGLVQLLAGAGFQSDGTNGVKFTSASDGSAEAGVQFQKSAGWAAGGSVLEIYDLLGTPTSHRGMFRILQTGGVRSGQSGFTTNAPTDGEFQASGWGVASTSNNQTGADSYYGGGAGTGNSATKGIIHFRTPDAGASGTAVQALTDKWTITRAGILTAEDGKDIAVGTTTGTKIGTATSQKLGFYNATPVVQRSDAGALTDSTGGTVNGTLVDVGVLFNQGNINDNFADCAAKINALRTAVRDLGLMA